MHRFINSIQETKPATFYYKASLWDSPLGDILMITKNEALCILEFVTRKNLKKNLEKLENPIVWEESSVIPAIKKFLTEYFEGKVGTIDFKIDTKGTVFQKKVWEKIKKIPHGQTISYSDIAQSIGFSDAHRAVANAVGQNKLAIIIPCHRVVNKNGNLGGYAGGIAYKKWLLAHEGAL
jgi:AraC family transcriptional regulator of adaptative response/methylated-DNA-[protein]-cysteine methyltransferase